MSEPTVRERFQGCLLGLAAGDALGTTLEFEQPGTFEPIDDMVGGGPFGLKPGQWTDDTSMALCLATSLVERAGFDAADQMQRYVRWWREGYLSSTGEFFDIGTTVSTALSRFEAGGDAFAGSTDPNTAGNGSLMRLAPVPMYFSGDAKEAIRMAADSSRTTHGSQEAVDACRYYAGLLVGALQGVGKETLLSASYCLVEGLWAREPLAGKIAAIAEGSFKHRQAPDIRGGFYVVETLDAALWAFHHSANFREGALLAANLGHDADTTAAIYGQLAGAYFGVEGIPIEWREKLTMVDRITSLADSLHDHARDHQQGHALTKKLTEDLSGDEGGGQIWPYGPIDDLDEDLPLFALWELEEDQQLLFKSAFNDALRDRGLYVDYDDAMRQAADKAWKSIGVTDDTLFDWLAKHEAGDDAGATDDHGQPSVASVTETTGEIRGVQVRWVSVVVSGHTVEQVLSYDIAEAEAVHGRPFDDEMDRSMQMGMFATDRIATDGTMFKVASATSYVLDGKCVRTAKIEHCDNIKPDSASWVITKADGSPVEQQLWSCVPGTPPIAHRELTRPDDTGGWDEERDGEQE